MIACPAHLAQVGAECAEVHRFGAFTVAAKNAVYGTEEGEVLRGCKPIHPINIRPAARKFQNFK